ncbi:MAG TPA: hypothetical protein VGX23_01605 [Actinocrinis sp.]|nr:hypothetical protein [Actinocrinis sp.]
MQQTFYSSVGWESWGLDGRPVIPDGMPILVDDDLLFEGARGPRSTVVANQWLRELPVSGCPAAKSWKYYAQVLRSWMEFIEEHNVALFDERARLKSALSAYAVFRAAGPVAHRFEATTWNQHMSVLGSFYRWAVKEERAAAEPFTYKLALAIYADQAREMRVNLATRRVPEAHVRVKYLEPEFVDLFLKALAGLGPDGSEDAGYRGRELARNAAVTRFALATGLRCQEFSYLLAIEVPPLPPLPTAVPVPLPVPAGLTKGGKFRTTWVGYEALSEVHGYLRMSRELWASGSHWAPPRSWGEPLVVSQADAVGGRVDGRRVRWAQLRPAERRRLVAPGGGSMLLALKSGGGPFTAWATVFARTGDRIRARFEPRFPHIGPHGCRHTFAMTQMERLVRGYYEQAARLSPGSEADAAWLLYLHATEPLLVLRDLLGHSTALTTEKYLHRLDMTRIFREVYERGAGGQDSADAHAAVQLEVDAEFDEWEV